MKGLSGGTIGLAVWGRGGLAADGGCGVPWSGLVENGLGEAELEVGVVAES